MRVVIVFDDLKMGDEKKGKLPQQWHLRFLTRAVHISGNLFANRLYSSVDPERLS